MTLWETRHPVQEKSDVLLKRHPQLISTSVITNFTFVQKQD